MTPATDVIGRQVLTALERLERVSVLGWVSAREVIATLPDDGHTGAHIDRAVRGLVRNGHVELWDDRHPPSGWNQSIRRVEVETS